MISETLQQYGLRDEFGEVVECAKDVLRENLETGVQQTGNQSGQTFCMRYQDMYIFSTGKVAAALYTEEIAKRVDEDVV